MALRSRSRVAIVVAVCVCATLGAYAQTENESESGFWNVTLGDILQILTTLGVAYYISHILSVNAQKNARKLEVVLAVLQQCDTETIALNSSVIAYSSSYSSELEHEITFRLKKLRQHLHLAQSCYYGNQGQKSAAFEELVDLCMPL